MINTTIREYYLLVILRSAAAGSIAAVYATFLLSKGLNLFEVNVVNFVFFFTLFVCEIPTGAFADVFGRKVSYITACTLFTISMVMYACAETVPGFIASEIIAGLASTFASGAFRAWFVDKLRHHGYTGKLDTIFARGSRLGQGSGLMSALLGGYLGNISLSLPWIQGGIFYLCGGIIAFMLKEEYFIPHKFSWTQGLCAMKQTMKSSVRYGMQDKHVRFILVIVTIQIFCLQAPNMQWQPLFTQNLQTHLLGYVWVGVALSIMFGNWIAPMILRKLKGEKAALVASQLVIGVGIIAATITGFPLSLALFFLHEVGRGAFQPIKDAYLHENIPSKERATIESFESIAHHGGGMIGLLVSGLLAFKAGIPITWILSGTVLITATLLVMKNSEK